MTRPFLFANKPVKAGLYKNKSKTIVTRMKNVSTALLFVVCMMLPQVGNAQEKKWIDFFSASLAGDVREISKEKSLKVKNIEKARAEMWKSWVKANEMFDEEKLVALENLEAAPYIIELADDLAAGFSEMVGRSLFDIDWERKYIYAGK